jgi:hypothetical protein
MTLFSLLLFLHVLGAIIAFGPSFSFPIIGAMGGKEPMHSNFGLRVTEAISHQRIFPLALVQGVTGLALVWAGNINLFGTPWLLAGITLYVIALGWAYFVQTPALKHLIELTSGGPPPPPAPGTPPPSGPPPHIAAAIQKVQRGGMLLGLDIAVIVFLMVTKPGA